MYYTLERTLEPLLSTSQHACREHELALRHIGRLHSEH